MKLHLGLDHDGHLPAFACVTESRTSDIEVARGLSLPKGSIVVLDKGYGAHRCENGGWLQGLDRRGVGFVTRARANIDATTLEEHPVKHAGVFFDRRIALNGKRPRELGVRPWRLVGFVCPDSGRPYTFLTNIHHLAASTIASIYKQRWQIELFFKLVKQNLKIKGFIGNSRNAVLTQIWSALCTILLLAYLKFLSRVEGSLQSILRLLQLNLFVRRDLGALVRATSPDPPPPTPQLALSL